MSIQRLISLDAPHLVIYVDPTILAPQLPIGQSFWSWQGLPRNTHFQYGTQAWVPDLLGTANTTTNCKNLQLRTQFIATPLSLPERQLFYKQ